jgi:hypothetical protein
MAAKNEDAGLAPEIAPEMGVELIMVIAQELSKRTLFSMPAKCFMAAYAHLQLLLTKLKTKDAEIAELLHANALKDAKIAQLEGLISLL